jgi:3-phytase
MSQHLDPAAFRPALVALVLVLCLAGCGRTQDVRFATFNASLNREAAGQLATDLSTPDNAQARAVATIVQTVRPDVLLVNEFDFDPDGAAARLFHDNYLAVAQAPGLAPLNFPYRFVAWSNTGVHSGRDLNKDGRLVTEPGTRDYGNDSLGFGLHPGQYAFVLYSRFPIDYAGIREFGGVLWKDMPDARLPTNADGSPWYDSGDLEVFRLSSKNHVDVPVEIGGTRVHVLASHPTPPGFDGPEDRNGRRNHDEIRLWADYITGGPGATYIVGMARAVGPIPPRGTFEPTLTGGFRGGRIEYDRPPNFFVIMGDLNADPLDGGSMPGAIDQLLKHPRVNASFVPRSDGAVEAARVQGGRNDSHRSDPQHDTADFGDGERGPGNLRVDYVLPSSNLRILDGGVFWPAEGQPGHELVKDNVTSDHRLVWLDLRVPVK